MSLSKASVFVYFFSVLAGSAAFHFHFKLKILNLVDIISVDRR